MLSKTVCYVKRDFCICDRSSEGGQTERGIKTLKPYVECVCKSTSSIRMVFPANRSCQEVLPTGPANGSRQRVLPTGPANGSCQRVLPTGYHPTEQWAWVLGRVAHLFRSTDEAVILASQTKTACLTTCNNHAHPSRQTLRTTTHLMTSKSILQS